MKRSIDPLFNNFLCFSGRSRPAAGKTARPGTGKAENAGKVQRHCEDSFAIRRRGILNCRILW